MKDSVKAPEISACHATTQPSTLLPPHLWPYGRWSLSVGEVGRGKEKIMEEMVVGVEGMEYINHQYLKKPKSQLNSEIKCQLDNCIFFMQ